MKIISKYKDYYDYLSGIYGIDEKLVLDRRNYTPLTYVPSVMSTDIILIGEYMIHGLWIDGKFLLGDAIEPYANQDREQYYWTESKYNKSEYWVIPDGRMSNLYCLKDVKFLGDNSPTWKHDCPIMLGYHDPSPFPILKDYNVGSLISPERIWLMLSEWLSKRITKFEEHVEPSNDIKIINSGFDLKESFRKRK